MFISYLVTYKELDTVGQPVKMVKVTSPAKYYNNRHDDFIEMMQNDGRTVEIIAMIEETALNTVSM